MVRSFNNTVKIILGTSIALFLLFGCKPLTALEQGASTKLTCGGNEPANSSDLWTLFVRNALTKCLVAKPTKFANSMSEAAQCVEADYNSNPLLEYVTVGVSTPHCVVVIDGDYCIPHELAALSDADAVTCIQASNSGASVTDKTTDAMSNGAYSANLCAWWCENHGY